MLFQQQIQLLILHNIALNALNNFILFLLIHSLPRGTVYRNRLISCTLGHNLTSNIILHIKIIAIFHHNITILVNVLGHDILLKSLTLQRRTCVFEFTIIVWT